MSNLPTEQPRGRLTIFLGYAAGGGKTFQMLEEGQALAAKGVDVVIGYFEPHARKDTIARAEGLETVSRRTVTYRGAAFLVRLDIQIVNGYYVISVGRVRCCESK